MKFLLITLLFIPFFGHSAVILKSKNNQSLVHLEGLKTRKGAFFEVLDLYGESKGLVQVKRVGTKKAIVNLKLGEMKTRWSLEPKSTKWANYHLNKYKRALLQKQKLKRKQLVLQKRRAFKQKRQLALQKRRNLLQRKRQLALQKRKRLFRQERILAASDDYPEDEEYLIKEKDFTTGNDDTFYKKTDDLSYVSSNLNLTVSLQGAGLFNFVKITPPNASSIFLKSYGYGGGLAIDGEVTPFLSTGGYIGTKRFAAQSQDKCGSYNPCSLEILYLSAGLNLKTTLVSRDGIKLIGGVEGSMLYPLDYINHAQLSPESFGFHGTGGVLFGAEISLGNLVIPITLKGEVVLPPTATTLFGMGSIQTGLGYKF